ncbi:MAG: imidazole glycerol phosphate synthase subunit HisH, partial [Chthoniobacterales bacterium]|nr:imidazole glycerol phosphate synthase subunit HisH [Chthoniobacterales bacterium]
MIAVLDYGAGNLRSVQNTLEAIGAAYEIVRDSAGLRHSAKILLPGVGNFGQMMRALERLEVREPLKERIAAGVPFLGICLGLQALFERSAEAPDVQGLGIFEGSVERFGASARIPHMGWNTLQPVKPSRLLQSGREPYVYFANSYYVPVGAATAATCTYTLPFTAVLERDNVFGVQFHPEKSGNAGLEIVRRFAA